MALRLSYVHVEPVTSRNSCKTAELSVESLTGVTLAFPIRPRVSCRALMQNEPREGIGNGGVVQLQEKAIEQTLNVKSQGICSMSELSLASRYQTLIVAMGWGRGFYPTVFSSCLSQSKSTNTPCFE